MQRYFVNSNQINYPYCIIKGSDYHHITKVMRMKLLDKVYISDNVNSYIAEIDNIDSETVSLRIVEHLEECSELPISVTIAHGLVRREKMEETIDYLTELGCDKYIPVMLKRSIVKMDESKLDKKLDRLNKIAKEAAEQSHRQKVLIVENIINIDELIKLKDEYDLLFVASPYASCEDNFKKYIDNNTKKILVLIGPEGGIDDKEIDKLVSNGFKLLTLGKRILRTQVAPLYVMSAISYLKEY